MATWTDKQLSSHKRAQGYLSSAGATLGVAALGAAGMKSKGAQKLGHKIVRRAHQAGAPLSVTGRAKRVAGKAAGSAGGLTTASAGVGGIGGFNFAAIQSQESKKARVKKMDYAEFSKAYREVQSKKTRRDIRGKDAAAGALGAVGGGAAALGALGLADTRTAVKMSRQHKISVSPRKVNIRAGKQAATLAAGAGAIAASDRLTRSADRQWAKSKKVPSSQIEKALRIPFKNSHVTRHGKSVDAPKPPKNRRSLPRPSESTTGLALLTGGTAGAGAAMGTVVNPMDREKRVKEMRKKGTLVKKSLSADVAASPFAKAFDPERSRKARLEGYQAGANMAAGAAGFAGALKIKRAGKGLKGATSIPVSNIKTGAKGAGLLAAGAGAAVGAKKIGDHRKGRGRSYKALPHS